MNRFPAAIRLAGDHLVAACLVAACLAGARAADRNIIIVQKGRAFHPAEVTIERGQTVTFTNDDSYLHQIYALGLFDSEEKAPGENLNETFMQAGTFLVRCHIHPTMRMTVHVR